ncbi:hypothetical protein HPP92_005530 [Vanilla planifolia]|uniref:protein-serine/threonine phosphatase n=1 Tax=Vanilla planifolia TaxID=51239 RepID=A0A835RU79_VANPL|nr:hypothetical protein HPP92_005530 [Vanilla planifolia]
MNEISTTGGLKFTIGNSLHETQSLVVNRLELMTDQAERQLDTSGGVSAAAAMMEVEEGDDSKGRIVLLGAEQENLGLVDVEIDRMEIVGAKIEEEEEDDTASVGPEPSLASDTSSVASALDELSNIDVALEVCTPSSINVEAIKGFENLATPMVEELSVDVMDVGVVCDEVKGQASVEQMEVHGTRYTNMKSIYLKDWVPLWGCISLCGRRPEMEDAVVVVPRFFDIPLWTLTSDCILDGIDTNKVSVPSHFFGVYDGHGGSQVAEYCHDRIHLALVEELSRLKEQFKGIIGYDGQKHWERAITDCFLKVDDEVGGKGHREGCLESPSENSLGSSAISDPIAPETVGSTAVVSIICSSHIIIANCGDSRAVLCRGKQALPLSVDHKPNRQDEYARIEAAGGKVIQWNGYRVFGVLAMSRSIGDRYLKPWIIPEPEVRVISRTKGDECLILAAMGCGT